MFIGQFTLPNFLGQFTGFLMSGSTFTPGCGSLVWKPLPSVEAARQIDPDNQVYSH